MDKDILNGGYNVGWIIMRDGCDTRVSTENLVMKEITDLEFQRRFGEYLDAALVEPVFVTKDARTQLAVLSYEEYKRLRAKAGIQKAVHVSELSKADIKTISEAKIPPGYDHLNEEMED